jgi:hypothetical protein
MRNSKIYSFVLGLFVAFSGVAQDTISSYKNDMYTFGQIEFLNTWMQTGNVAGLSLMLIVPGSVRWSYNLERAILKLYQGEKA